MKAAHSPPWESVPPSFACLAPIGVNRKWLVVLRDLSILTGSLPPGLRLLWCEKVGILGSACGQSRSALVGSAGSPYRTCGRFTFSQARIFAWLSLRRRSIERYWPRDGASLCNRAPKIWQLRTLAVSHYEAANLNWGLWDCCRSASCFFGERLVRDVAWPPDGVCNVAPRHGAATPVGRSFSSGVSAYVLGLESR